MKFIRDILSRKPSQPETITPTRPFAEHGANAAPGVPESEKAGSSASVVEAAAPKRPGRPPVSKAGEAADDDILKKVNAKISAPVAVNIWDLEKTEEPQAQAPAQAAPEPSSDAPTGRRRRNNKTRVLGFTPAVVDDNAAAKLNETPDAVEPTESSEAPARVRFPVGLVMVTKGPGRGECFVLEAGMSPIGRAEGQAVQLDFGDAAISRSNHAAIVYDIETHKFTIGHGGKKNVVRLNGSPVISNEALASGDEIKIGETLLRFVALCDEQFNWADAEEDHGSDDDVAIA